MTRYLKFDEKLNEQRESLNRLGVLAYVTGSTLTAYTSQNFLCPSCELDPAEVLQGCFTTRKDLDGWEDFLPILRDEHSRLLVRVPKNQQISAIFQHVEEKLSDSMKPKQTKASNHHTAFTPPPIPPKPRKVPRLDSLLRMMPRGDTGVLRVKDDCQQRRFVWVPQVPNHTVETMEALDYYANLTPDLWRPDNMDDALIRLIDHPDFPEDVLVSVYKRSDDIMKGDIVVRKGTISFFMRRHHNSSKSNADDSQKPFQKEIILYHSNNHFSLFKIARHGYDFEGVNMNGDCMFESVARGLRNLGHTLQADCLSRQTAMLRWMAAVNRSQPHSALKDHAVCSKVVDEIEKETRLINQSGQAVNQFNIGGTNFQEIVVPYSGGAVLSHDEIYEALKFIEDHRAGLIDDNGRERRV